MSERQSRPRVEEPTTSSEHGESHTPKRRKHSPKQENQRLRSTSPENAFAHFRHLKPGSPTTVSPAISNGHLHPLSNSPEDRRRRASITAQNAKSPTSRSPYAKFQVDPIDDKAAAELPDATFRIGTRKSKLARIQTELIATALQYLYPDHLFPVQPMSTMGDLNKVIPLYQFDAKALWTRELEVALLEGEIDMIVHSLKDMPTTLPDGCELGCITEREDPRDAVVMKASLPYKSLDELPKGSIVGTSSVRRIAQLRRAYPHLSFADIRGNVDTRLNKLDNSESPNFSAIILAEAGLARMELNHRSRCLLSAPTVLHAVGQGSLGVEIRQGDEKTKKLLAPLNHRESRLRCLAERSLMRSLEGGCSVPIGVETSVDEDGKRLVLKGVVVSVDGAEAVAGGAEIELDGDESSLADELGIMVAEELRSKGAQSLLDNIKSEKESDLEKGNIVTEREKPSSPKEVIAVDEFDDRNKLHSEVNSA